MENQWIWSFTRVQDQNPSLIKRSPRKKKGQNEREGLGNERERGCRERARGTKRETDKWGEKGGVREIPELETSVEWAGAVEGRTEPEVRAIERKRRRARLVNG